MLLPEPEINDKEPKRSEAVFVTDRIAEIAGKWERIISFHFEGEVYDYVLAAVPLPGSSWSGQMNEAEARRRLYSPKIDDELRTVFLKEVPLDMTRPH